MGKDDFLQQTTSGKLRKAVINHEASTLNSAPAQAAGEGGVVGYEKKAPLQKAVIYHDPTVVQFESAEAAVESGVVGDEKKAPLQKAVIYHDPTVVQFESAEAVREGVTSEGNKPVNQKQELLVLGAPLMQKKEVALAADISIRKKLEALKQIDQCVFEHNGVPFGANGEFATRGVDLLYRDQDTVEYVDLCNFHIKAVKRKLVYCNRKPTESFLDFVIAFRAGIKEVRVRESEWASLYEAIRKACPGTSFSVEGTKHPRRFDRYIAFCLDNIETEREYLSAGWNYVSEDKQKFLHDGVSHPGLTCKTGKTIEVDPQLSYKEAFLQSLGMLSMARELGEILIPWLFQHLGLLFSMFCRAGLQPNFLLFIAGPSGALKTALAKVLFSLYSGESNRVMASFKDTITALEVKMFEHGDGVLNIDDFHPPVSSGEKKEMSEKLEFVTRVKGDGLAKGRSNVQLTLQEELMPHCLVSITGEFLSGGESSLLRLLIVQLKRGDIDGKKLEFYQKNSRVWSTHLQGFLIFIENNQELVIGFIKKEFETKRQAWGAIFKEKRLVDAATHMEVIAAIVFSYAKWLGALPESEINVMYAQWRSVIGDMTAKSIAATKQAKPVVLFLEAVEYLVDNKAQLASSRAQYGAEQEDWVGFIEGSFVFFDHKKLCSKVGQYWRDHGKACKLLYTDIFAELAEMGITKVSREGKERKPYYQKVSIGAGKAAKRPRMLVVQIEAMVAFLEAERQDGAE